MIGLIIFGSILYFVQLVLVIGFQNDSVERKDNPMPFWLFIACLFPAVPIILFILAAIALLFYTFYTTIRDSYKFDKENKRD